MEAEAAKAEAGKQEARARVATRRYEAELESLQVGRRLSKLYKSYNSWTHRRYHTHIYRYVILC